jgi:hypothetical protein
MFQPFELLKKEYLPRLVSMGKIYLVTQSYHRGFNHFAESHTIDILVTSYNDRQYAEVHKNAVKNDKYASIIQLSSDMHKQKLIEMIEGEQYAVYWAVVKSDKELQERMKFNYADNIRRYVDRHTNWKISGDSSLKVQLEVIFGELQLVLKHGSKQQRVTFEDIEKS